MCKTETALVAQRFITPSTLFSRIDPPLERASHTKGNMILNIFSDNAPMLGRFKAGILEDGDER
jgi:hypothetical protein